MNPVRSVKVIGTGRYVPSRIMSNDDFAKFVDTSDEWITTRTGIKERRIAAADEFTSTMATAAARAALTDARLEPKDIDLVIVATITRSRSIAWTPASRSAASAAGRQRSEVACSGAAIRRSLIPVRVWIHSSLVSTIRARSSFESTRSGA